MTRRRALWLALAIGLAWGIAKEYQEPYLRLFLADWVLPREEPQVIPLEPGIEGFLFSDPRPHIGKIARLQKGLALRVDGTMVIEEGFGFGLPLIQVGQQAYLSRSAEVTSTMPGIWRKRYVMDTIDTPSGFLRKKYVPVAPIGHVDVLYMPDEEGLWIEVDLTGMQVPWDGVFLMNEQGAVAFDRYEEPDEGRVVTGIGPWEPTEARVGCMASERHQVRFCVYAPGGWEVLYGRERYVQFYWVGLYTLSWAGVDLHLAAPADRVRYRITVERWDDE